VKNKIWKPNLELIKKIEILEDQIQFSQIQLDEIMGKIARKSKFRIN
jgi:hypothetical protein